jgi:surfeit locus 1 family protein
MPAAFEFRRPGLWPTLAAALCVAAGLMLGDWQLDRARQKNELKARFEQGLRSPPIRVAATELAASDVEWRRVEARGVFEPALMVLIDNRVLRGVPGYHVVMPLKIGDRHVLVNRGWIAGTRDRGKLPEIVTPAGVVTVEGVAVVPGRAFELSARREEGRVWQNLSLERYRERMAVAIQPFVIRQEGGADDGLVRQWEAPDFGIDKHYGYAFQWFALAATALGFYLVIHVKRRRQTEEKPR